MREVQKRQLQFGQVPVDKVWLRPQVAGRRSGGVKGLQHLYKEKQEELFMPRSTFFQGPTAGWGVRGWRCGGF